MERKDNLYYVFLADKEANRMSEEKSEEILKNILDFYEKIKPP